MRCTGANHKTVLVFRPLSRFVKEKSNVLDIVLPLASVGAQLAGSGGAVMSNCITLAIESVLH